MSSRGVLIQFTKGFKVVGSATMVTTLSDSEALKCCKEKFPFHTCRLAKPKAR